MRIVLLNIFNNEIIPGKSFPDNSVWVFRVTLQAGSDMNEIISWMFIVEEC